MHSPSPYNYQTPWWGVWFSEVRCGIRGKKKKYKYRGTKSTEKNGETSRLEHGLCGSVPNREFRSEISEWLGADREIEKELESFTTN